MLLRLPDRPRFLCREGCRKSEAESLEWTDLDLDVGAVNLDENKTDDPRAWSLDPGTAEALRRWKTIVALGVLGPCPARGSP